MKVTGLLETSLYVHDVDRSRRFYQDLFGFETIVGDDRFCALRVADRQLLLLFRKRATLEPRRIPGGVIPPHDGDGTFHFAFAIPAEDFDKWCERIGERGLKVESVVTWEEGGRSLYLRDPDGHLIELATPGTWTVY